MYVMRNSGIFQIGRSEVGRKLDRERIVKREIELKIADCRVVIKTREKCAHLWTRSWMVNTRLAFLAWREGGKKKVKISRRQISYAGGNIAAIFQMLSALSMRRTVANVFQCLFWGALTATSVQIPPPPLPQIVIREQEKNWKEP